MIENCTAVILAGGESKRMGQEKASLMLGGDSLLNRAIRNVQPLFGSLLVSVRPPGSGLPHPQVCDRSEARGPMAGIAAALEQATSDWVFALACDMPFVAPELIRAMAERRDGHAVVVAKVHGGLQPLAAFYARSCLPQMQRQLADGRRSLKTLIGEVATCTMQQEECARHDQKLLSFFDLDTPAAVARAESILQESL